MHGFVSPVPDLIRVNTLNPRCHFPTFWYNCTLYTDMQLNLPFHIKPVHTLLAASALLAIAVMLFFYSNRVPVENMHSETSEGVGPFYSPLMCI